MGSSRLYFVHQLSNGLTLLAESMSRGESVSWTLSIPCGPVYESPELAGLSNLTCDMTLRGAGSRDSRTLLEAFENIGCETSEGVVCVHTGFSASLLADKLLPALELLRDVVRFPHLPEDQLDAAKLVALQDVYALEDDPAQKMILELQRQFFPDPWGRSGIGSEESIERLTITDIRRHHAAFYQPNGAILSVAGRFDWNSLRDHVETLFGDWKPQPTPLIQEKTVGKTFVHLPYDSTQTQIGVAFPCPAFSQPNSLETRCAVGILSGGMDNRLFNELRENRGLCYSVYASHVTLKDRAGVFCYCGTGSDRARESLDVLLAELDRLRLGIDADELRRLKTRLRSDLLLQQESTASRCASLARDWYHLGRIRSLQEIEAAVQSLTLDGLNDYFAAHPAGPFHVVTLGPG